MTKAHAVDLAQYELYQNGRHDERDPLPADQHQLIDRFADDLPPELYDEEFVDDLKQHFPIHEGMTREEGQRVYVAVLEYVEQCLEAWAPDA